MAVDVGKSIDILIGNSQTTSIITRIGVQALLGGGYQYFVSAIFVNVSTISILL